ncbi:MAG: diguanylate cyclase domain-containing protein, partial [Acidimicrobiales bacterium]
MGARLRALWPGGVTDQVRAVFLALSLTGLVSVMAQERPTAPLGWWALPVSLAGGAALAAIWLTAYRRRATPWWVDGIEVCGLLAVGAGLAVPSALFGVFFPALMYRWLAGGNLRALSRAASFVAVLGLVAHIHPGGGPSETAGALLAGVSFAVPITLLSTRALAVLLSRHEALACRERELVEVMEHRATHDGLTGLANRYKITQALQELTASGDGAVLILDLDNFKVVNDVFGHPAGDTLLRDVAERLSAAVRPGEVLGRLGGDEFAMIAPGAGAPSGAIEVGSRMISALDGLFEAGGRDVSVSASAGASVAGPGLEPGDLLRQADTAMYAAKQAGRGRVALFEERMHLAVDERLRLGEEIRLSVASGQLVLHYQPIL